MSRYWTCSLRFSAVIGGLVVGIGLFSCSKGQMNDPAKVLANPNESTPRHRAAVSMLEDQTADDTTIRLLKRMIISDEYSETSRVLAYERLRSLDPEGLRRLLEIRLPRSKRLQWRVWLCEKIAEERWIDMTPTLIRAWATPISNWNGPPDQRPERLALVEIYGEDKITEVLLRVMLDANPITAANLRTRCWELLIEEGQKAHLVEVLAETEVQSSDGMLSDLREISSKTGILPRNREEILWARALCEPENEQFLNEVNIAISKMPEHLRNDLELRDLAIVRATFEHDPSLFEMDEESLYVRLDASVRSRERRVPTANFTGWSQGHTESLHEVREKLRWGDYMAMLIAVEALGIPEVLDHVFDYAERDLEDKSTEYGGLIALDSQGRFVVLEFKPRMTEGDNRFVASQQMFDASYTAIFHFHNHAQSYDNSDYAGPHLGDFTYANNTRANCLVFTFLNSRTIDVDFYRYDRVVVDLGAMARPE